MLTEQFSVAEWSDGVSVYDHSTGDTHVLDHASFDLFQLAIQPPSDQSLDRQLIVCLRQRMSGSDEELLVFGRDLLSQLGRLGLINSGTGNCQN